MNPSQRLLTIYEILIAQQHDQQMAHTWAEVFGLDKNNPNLEDDVTACVIALRQQIDFVRMRLSEHDVPLELTSPGFDRFKNVASPGQLHSSWNSHRGNLLPPENRLAFMWASYVLRDDDEADIPAEEAIALRAEIESLEKSLQETEMSPYLRGFIRQQVNTIRSALRLYSVQGVRPLQDALHKVAGAYTVERSRIETEHATAPEAAKGVFAKTSGVIKKAAEICDNLDKIKKFGEGAWSLGAAVGSLVLPYIDPLLK